MRHSPLRTRAVAFGILVVASVLGNVSFSASRAKPDAPLVARVADAVDNDRVAEVSSPGPSVEQRMVDDRAAASDVPRIDGGQIVPAIYSWDPDVTFVFYRHVTKWM